MGTILHKSLTYLQIMLLAVNIFTEFFKRNWLCPPSAAAVTSCIGPRETLHPQASHVMTMKTVYQDELQRFVYM